MDDDIALLRREALSSISTKGSRYGIDGLFGRHEHSAKKSVRGRRMTSPDITREVLGAFGLKPSASRQYMKVNRSKVKSQPRRKSAMSSRSRSSESRSYSSYSSSSRSRSRSSSSSSNHSSYSRSSSYSGSSQSRSPRYDPLTPPYKTKRKGPRPALPLPRSNSDKLLERHHHKKPRYAEDLSPSPGAYYHDSHHSHRRISKNAQFAHSRKRSADRLETAPYSRPTRRPERSDDYYHQSSHHMNRHKMLRPVHHSPPPPHYSHRLPPSRSHVQKDRHYRQRPMSYGSGKYHSRASHLESVPRYRDRGGYHEEERSSLRRPLPPRPHHSSSRGNGHDNPKSSSPSHEIKDRFIVVEESSYPDESQPSRKSYPDKSQPSRKSYPDESQPSRKSYPDESQPNRKLSGKQSSNRQDCNRRTRDTTPDHTFAENHVIKQKLSTREAETKQRSTGDDEPRTTDMVSAAIKSAGDDSFGEELDYNEDMDNLDLHPRELLDVRVDEVLEEGSLRDEGQQSPSWSGEESANDGGSHHSKTSSDCEGTRIINSPLRVSPERSGQKEESWSSHGRVPVKQRLYLSKQKIEEKKRSARHHTDKSPSELRPSLANRLGPPHHSRHGSQRGFRRWGSDVPAKGSAMAIAEAYRKQKEAGKKVVLCSHKGDKSGIDKDNEASVTRKITGYRSK